MEGLTLAPPGEQHHYEIPEETINHRAYGKLSIQHGSSLSLISQATTMLSKYFTATDPEKDFKKWRKIGAKIYYLCIFDPGTSILCSVVRILLDGDFSQVGTSEEDGEFCQRRIIIDYIFTLEQAQGKGYGSRMFNQVEALAKRYRCNLYVSALEESCVYWMSKGFILEEGKINQRLNGFPDTMLLKMPSNKPESEETINMALVVSDEEMEEPKEDDEDYDEDVVMDEAVDDDVELQKALLQSMANSSTGNTPLQAHVTPPSNEDDAGLAAAIAMSASESYDADLQRALELSKTTT